MKKNKVFIIKVFIILGFTLAFLGCKKYPENKGIHLALPKNRIVEGIDYKITVYRVNGEDSLALLSTKFGQDISTITWTLGIYHNEFRLSDRPLQKTNGCSFILSDDQKKMIVQYYLKNDLDGYNMFLTLNSEWDILKLYKKNKKTTLKLKREYNGKTYIIQFNN